MSPVCTNSIIVQNIRSNFESVERRRIIAAKGEGEKSVFHRTVKRKVFKIYERGKTTVKSSTTAQDIVNFRSRN